MTTEQAGEVFAILNAAFPREALEEATIALWLAELRELRYHQAAVDTARSIARGADGFPTINQFRRSYRELVERRTEGRMIEAPVDDGPREVPAEVRQWMQGRGIRTP